METVIDWNEAPEWATGHCLIAFQGITRVWFNDEQYAVYDRDGGPYPWGGGKGDTRHNHTRSAIEYPTNRPAPWTGKGLPPVGTVCEINHPNMDWVRCEIVAHKVMDCGGKTHAIAWIDGDTLDQSQGLRFRPIRTPEQIEAEARQKGIEELGNFLSTNTTTPTPFLWEAAQKIYDAGYRKQVAP